jgi:hypothetical protein
MDYEFMTRFEDFFNRISYRFIEDIEYHTGEEYDIFCFRRAVAKVLRNNPNIVDPRDELLFDLVLEKMNERRIANRYANRR